ncbi:MAG: DUF503 domain-containing protein [SAR202 cluster bacterium]|nr:DUF503 domain-containing protein [SAR202 cluster bacterium]
MNIGACKITLRIPESHSLKGKRRVIGSICARVRNKFNVSISEVGDNDVWQIAVLGVTTVSNSARHADDTLNQVVSFIEANREDLEVVSVEQETMTGF